MKVVRDYMAEANLKAVIVRVTIDGKEIVTAALGESMTGVPATIDMHFRNGAVAISYVSTLLLLLVEEGKVSLADKVSKWLPELPNADKVNLRQLAQMTSGIPGLRAREQSSSRRKLRPIRSGPGRPKTSSRSPSTSRCGTNPARTSITPTRIT